MKKSSRPAAKSRGRREGRPAPPQVVILAAGLGSRMHSTLPKVLHRVSGLTLLESVLRAAESLSPSRIIAVLGPARVRIEPELSGRDVRVVSQDPPRGTGDAAHLALAAVEEDGGPVLILSGDVPLIRHETLGMLLARFSSASLDLAFLSFRPPDPGDLGRVVRDRRGRVKRIVEVKNAGRREKEIGEVNAGVYCFAPAALSRAARQFRADPVSREVYLTDAVEILASSGGRVECLETQDWREVWGINTRQDLAAAEEIARRRALERVLDAGATLVDPATTRIGVDVSVEADVILHPFVSLEGRSILREGCEVLPFTRIVNSEISSGATIGPHCDIEGAKVGRRARVGPFARVRPDTILEEDVRVGNFVETKKAVLHRGVKASHLSYLGDVEIGAETNVGAGVITCNYDGKAKHTTRIGAGAFIGSDSQLIAPVTIGEGAYVGAGSTITEDVPAGALALSRGRQKNISGWAKRRAADKASDTSKRTVPRDRNR